MRRARTAAFVAALALLGTAPPAPAHEGNPNFRSEVTAVVPSTDGIEVQVLNFDDSMRLTNRSGEDVVIEGYEGEPYARLLADGTVEVNRNSEATYLNDDRYADAEVPESANPEAPPDWEEIDRSSTFTWHDHRMHWMSTNTPPQVEDESKETKIFDYEIPIELGGDAGAIEGTLIWVGEDSGFPVAPFIGLAVVALGAGVVIVIARRRRAGGDRERPEAW
jgi:hypothetical protein